MNFISYVLFFIGLVFLGIKTVVYFSRCKNNLQQKAKEEGREKEFLYEARTEWIFIITYFLAAFVARLF